MCSSFDCIIEVQDSLITSAIATKHASISVLQLEGPSIPRHFATVLAGIAVNSPGMKGAYVGVTLVGFYTTTVVVSHGSQVMTSLNSTVRKQAMSIGAISVLSLNSECFINSSVALSTATGAATRHHHTVSIFEGGILAVTFDHNYRESATGVAALVANSRHGGTIIAIDNDISFDLNIMNRAALLFEEKTVQAYVAVAVCGVAASSTFSGAVTTLTGGNTTSLLLTVKNEAQLHIPLGAQHVSVHTTLAVASVISSAGYSDANVHVGVASPMLLITTQITNHCAVYMYNFDKIVAAISGIAVFNAGVVQTSTASIVLNSTSAILKTTMANNVSFTHWGPGGLYSSSSMSSITATTIPKSGGSTISTNGDTALTLNTDITHSSTVSTTLRSGAIAASSIVTYTAGSGRSEIVLSPQTSTTIGFLVDTLSTFRSAQQFVKNLISVGSIVAFVTETGTATVNYSPSNIYAPMLLDCVANRNSLVELVTNGKHMQQSVVTLCSVAAVALDLGNFPNSAGRGTANFNLTRPMRLRSIINHGSQLTLDIVGAHSTTAISSFVAMGQGDLTTGRDNVLLETAVSTGTTLTLDAGQSYGVVALSSLAFWSATTVGGGIHIIPNTALVMRAAIVAGTQAAFSVHGHGNIIAVAAVVAHGRKQDQQILLPATSNVSMVLAISNASSMPITLKWNFNVLAFSAISTWNDDGSTNAASTAISLHGSVRMKFALAQWSTLAFIQDYGEGYGDGNSFAIGSIVSYARSGGTNRDHLLLSNTVGLHCVLDDNAAMTLVSTKPRIDNAFSFCSVVSRTVRGGKMLLTGASASIVQLYISTLSYVNLQTNCRHKSLVAIASVMAFGETSTPAFVTLNGTLSVKFLVQFSSSVFVDTVATTVTARNMISVSSISLWIGDLVVGGRVDLKSVIAATSTVGLVVRSWPVSHVSSHEPICSVASTSTDRVSKIALGNSAVVKTLLVLQNTSNVSATVPKRFSGLVGSVFTKEITLFDTADAVMPRASISTTIVLVSESFIHQNGDVDTSCIIDSAWFALSPSQQPIPVAFATTFCRTLDSPLPSCDVGSGIRMFLESTHINSNFSSVNGTIDSVADVSAPEPCQHSMWASVARSNVSELGNRIVVEAFSGSSSTARSPASWRTSTVSPMSDATRSPTISMNGAPSVIPSTTTTSSIDLPSATSVPMNTGGTGIVPTPTPFISTIPSTAPTPTSQPSFAPSEVPTSPSSTENGGTTTESPSSSRDSGHTIPTSTVNATEVTANATTEEASASTKVTIVTTTTVGTVVGTVTSVAGGSAATDMQTMIALSLSRCATTSLRSVADASRRTLFPLDDLMGQFEGSALLGSVVFLVCACALHTIVVAVRVKAKHNVLKTAAAKVKYPSHSLLVANLLYQGIALESCAILFRSTNNVARSAFATTLASLCFIMCLVVPGAYLSFGRKYIHNFRFYRYDHAGRSQFLGMFVYPTGQWDPKNDHCRMFKNICGLLNGNDLWMFASNLQIRSLLVAIIVTMEGLDCEVQAALLCVVFFAHTLLLLAFRPLRMRTTNSVCPLISFLSAILAITMLFEDLGKINERILTAMTILTVVGAGIQLFAMISEKLWKKRRLAKFVVGHGPASPTDFYSSSDSGEDTAAGPDVLSVPLNDGSTEMGELPPTPLQKPNHAPDLRETALELTSKSNPIRRDAVAFTDE